MPSQINTIPTEISSMLRKTTDSIVAATLIATLSPRASAALIQWRVDQGGNGHSYEVVNVASPVGWDTAKTLAESRGGYLATLTSAAENDFVGTLVQANGRNAFLGGFQIDPSAPRPMWAGPGSQGKHGRTPTGPLANQMIRDHPPSGFWRCGRIACGTMFRTPAVATPNGPMWSRWFPHHQLLA